MGGLVVAMPFRAKTPVKESKAPQVQSSATSPGARVSLAIGVGPVGQNPKTERFPATTEQAEPADLSNQVSANAFGDNRLPEIESDYQSLLRPLPGRDRATNLPQTSLQGNNQPRREVPHELQSYEVTQSPGQAGDGSQQAGAIGPVEPRLLDGEATRGSRPVREVAQFSPVAQPGQPSSDWVARRAPVRSARTYRLRDGDTLRELASRFLGDPNRAGEIHQMNRAVIQHPEVLPLGVEIKIPNP